MIENVLICGTNWLGDSIMSMPAIQCFKQKYPSCRITILVKHKLGGLWAMHPCMDSVIELQDGLSGILQTVGMIKQYAFDEAFVFPNSFRSALVPFLAGIPSRHGLSGHQRKWMLSNVVQTLEHPGRKHQAWEYLQIMNLSGECKEIPIPGLSVPEGAVVKAREMLGQVQQKKWIGLMPGAAYGPAKRWPSEYFVEVGKTLSKSGDYGILLMGSQQESDLCLNAKNGIGEKAVSLAGRTSLPELAALLGLCSAVVTNDSGGMHLASAVGTKVVAIFGITDPSKTGPLGKDVRVIFDKGINHSRDIKRISVEAEASLRSIKPERVYDTVLNLLAAGSE
ncbi:MAG: lipopolysaccharide heptosyltransferase II [Kiritimatiellae bacterium]|nr:lipopolysaccharide heptosyltransferase II [Kiritimatiellia bacterium]MDD5522340.1 lipopolysaccharide heptosyltransferase II [Kiritimatiellia bacterium]